MIPFLFFIKFLGPESFAMFDHKSGIIATKESLYAFAFTTDTETFTIKSLRTHCGYHFSDIASVQKHNKFYLFNRTDNLVYKLNYPESKNPKNIHFMMNFELERASSFRVNSEQSLLAFPAEQTRVVILSSLDKKEREYSSFELPGNEILADFRFLKNSRIMSLSECGALRLYSIERRRCEMNLKIHVLGLLSSNFGKNGLFAKNGSDQLICGLMSICDQERTLVVATEHSDLKRAHQLAVFGLDQENSPELSFRYVVDTGLSSLAGSRLTGIFMDYFIGDFPILFAFPEIDPQVMQVYIFYARKGKKICTLDTLHLGKVMDVRMADYHVVSICDGGVFNALQVV